MNTNTIELPDKLKHRYTITSKELSDITKMSHSYWSQKRQDGKGPKFISISERSVLYRWSDVQEWWKNYTKVCFSSKERI